MQLKLIRDAMSMARDALAEYYRDDAPVMTMLDLAMADASAKPEPTQEPVAVNEVNEWGVGWNAGYQAAKNEAAPTQEPDDAELLRFAIEEEFLLFCSEDEVLDIMRTTLQQYRATPPDAAAQIAELERERDDATVVSRRFERELKARKGEIAQLRAENAALRDALHQISLASQNSMSSQRECGVIARTALEKCK